MCERCNGRDAASRAEGLHEQNAQLGRGEGEGARESIEKKRERKRLCVLACFSSLSTRVIVKGLCRPGGRPTAIFIVRNVATVMSNWELWDECIWGI